MGEMVVEDGILEVLLMETPKPMLVGVVADDKIRGCDGAGVMVTPPTVFPARILLFKRVQEFAN